ncbi:MAG: CPBP family intramembrane metalloprotease [Acidobacteriota bacterium]|nr:CPBP family intramembrane metalloprotease [Acidobacteriota bacterium]
MPQRGAPAWGYHDLALFLSAVLPSLALSAALLRVSLMVAPVLLSSSAARTLLFQSFMYVFLVGSLYLVIVRRYGSPFWSALGWTFEIPCGWLLMAAGPLLTILLSVLGVLLRAPSDSSQIEVLIKSRASLAAVMLFGVVLAPIFEEMLFRGFLLPLLARSLGPWLGIFLTALLFGLLHGAQNYWAWQPIMLIGVAGIVFGYVRYKTKSTTSAFVMHSAYNATGFLGYALTHWQLLN